MGWKSLKGQDLHAIRFTTREGLSSNTVYACLQDKSGSIWMATEFGVTRFDGNKMEKFGQENGLSDNDVFKLYQDSRQRIWFLMSNGTVSYFRKNRFYNSKTDRSILPLSCKTHFNGVQEDREGNLWFTTISEGIFRMAPNGNVRHFRPISDIPGTHILPGIWIGPDGMVRAVSSAGVLNLSRDPGEVETPGPEKPGSVEYATGLKNGQVLIGMQRRLYRSQGPHKNFEVLDPSVFSYDRIITGITEDQEGDLWISSLFGLHRFRGSRLNSLDHHHFLRSKSISGVLADRGGNLWISTLNEGVFLVRDRSIGHYARQQGLSEVPVTALFRGKEGIWFGNDRGEIGLIKSGQLTQIQIPVSSFYWGRGRIRDFMYDPKGKFLWVLSENGIYTIKNESIFSHLPTGAKSLAFDSTGKLILGTAYNAYSYPESLVLDGLAECRRVWLSSGTDETRINDIVKKTLPNHQPLLPSTRVYKIRQDQDNALWFATNSGLYSRQYDKILYHRPYDEMLGKAFQNLEILSDGSVVLGCNGYGLLHVRNKTISVIDKAGGLISTYIKSLRQFGQDSLWACTPNGLHLIVFKADENRYTVEKWTESDGLVSEDLTDIAFSGDTAFLASPAGITAYSDFFFKEKAKSKSVKNSHHTNRPNPDSLYSGIKSQRRRP